MVVVDGQVAQAIAEAGQEVQYPLLQLPETFNSIQKDADVVELGAESSQVFRQARGGTNYLTIGGQAGGLDGMLSAASKRDTVLEVHAAHDKNAKIGNILSQHLMRSPHWLSWCSAMTTALSVQYSSMYYCMIT